MNVRPIEQKVIANIKEGYDWNNLICSMTKDELKEFVNSEEHYMYIANDHIRCEALMERLKRENPDMHVHLYLDADYRGTTNRIKHFFLYFNEQIYDAMFHHEFDRQGNRWWLSQDHYGLDVNYAGNDMIQLQSLITESVLKHVNRLVSAPEKVYLILRLFKSNVVRVF